LAGLALVLQCLAGRGLARYGLIKGKNMDDLQVIDRIETQFNTVIDAAYDEHCKRMILMDAMQDIIEDGTCSASIREIAQYAMKLVNDKT